MARVIRISASDAKYGGNIYESNINKALQNFNITTFFALSWVPKKIRYFFAPIFYLLNFIKCNFCDADIVIVPLEAISFYQKRKKTLLLFIISITLFLLSSQVLIKSLPISY